MKERLTQLSEVTQLPLEFECPICYEPMDEPVMTQVGQNYHRDCIENALHIDPRDPITREGVSFENLYPNLYLKNCINKWLEENNQLESVLIRVKELETVNASQALKIEELETIEQERMETFTQIRDTIVSMQAQFKKYEQTVADQERQISSLTRENTRKARQIANKHQRIESLNNQNHRHEEQVKTLEEEIAQQQGIIDSLKNENNEQKIAIKVLSKLSPKPEPQKKKFNVFF